VKPTKTADARDHVSEHTNRSMIAAKSDLRLCPTARKRKPQEMKR
jgi:hypothetical protein